MPADDEASAPDLLATRRKLLELCCDMTMGFWYCRKPTISAVHGHCLAGGCELALACDITIASQDAIFGEPELRFGAGIVCLILPWLTGPKQAKELIFTGNDRIPAERALAMGLVNRVVPEGDALPVAMEMAAQIAVMDEHAMALSKAAINRTYEIMGLREAVRCGVDLDVEINLPRHAGPPAIPRDFAPGGPQGGARVARRALRSRARESDCDSLGRRRRVRLRCPGAPPWSRVQSRPHSSTRAQLPSWVLPRGRARPGTPCWT